MRWCHCYHSLCMCMTRFFLESINLTLDEKYVYDLVFFFFFNKLSRLRMERGISVKRDETQSHGCTRNLHVQIFYSTKPKNEKIVYKFILIKMWVHSFVDNNKENYINKDISRCDYNPLSSSLNYYINKNVITILCWKW